MRYTYYFQNHIEAETVQELIDVIMQVEAIDLFFTTEGGELSSMKVLLHAIEQHPDINIFLTGYIASAGTFLLTDCTKPVYLTEDLDWILFHQGDRGVEGEFRKTILDRTALHAQLKQTNEEWSSKFKKLGLNSKEIKRFNEGDDVVLYKKDFHRLKVAKHE